MTISDTIKRLQRRKNAIDRDIQPDPASWPNESEVLGRAIEGLERLQWYERRRLYIFEGKKERAKWR